MSRNDAKLNLTQVIRLRGKEYSGLSSKDLQHFYNIRLEFLKQLDENIVITTHATRNLIYLNNKVKNNNGFFNRIIHKWDNNFKTSYQTYHYIVITTSDLLGKGFVSKVENKFSTSYLHKKKKLESSTKAAYGALHEFEPKILEKSELLSFFTSYINGKKVNQSVPSDGYINRDELIESTIQFPKNKDYMIYKNNDETYSKWLSIKLFENDKFTHQLLEDLMSYKAEFTIYQTFQKYNISSSLEIISDKEKNLATHSQSTGQKTFNDMDIIKENIEQGNTFLFKHSFTIQIKNKDLQKLKSDIENIKNIVDTYGFRTAIESTNIEPLYWSILPSYENLNATKRNLLSQNISQLNTFTTVFQGFKKCSWGNAPVTTFYTSANTNYYFTFHNSTKDTALGHTLVIAGSESGKTTLTSFLATQSLKFDDLTVIAFDKLHGLYSWANFNDGAYVEFDGDVGLNPLQLQDTNSNRNFLNNFFKIMSKRNDPVSIKKIDEAIKQLYTHLPKEKRNLKEFYLALGSKTADENDVISNIESWVSGSNSTYFNSKMDSLSFDNKINVFAMDTIFQNAEAPALVSLYIFQQIKQLNKPVLIFIDEIVSYLKNEYFANAILEILIEIRKKNGVVILAAQDYKFFLETEVGSQILGTSLANLILFPEPADENYQKALNLTDQEFKYITTETDKRKILFKRVQDGTSTILNVDLSLLGNDLKIYDSSTNSVEKIKRFKNKYPNSWKEKYLND